MLQPLTIAVAQPATVLHDVVANADHHADIIRGAAARVVVFPELSLTGYVLDAEPIDPDDARLEPIIDACRAAGTIAFAGAPTRGPGDGVHISMLRIDGDGVAVAYNKMWLGGDEPATHTAGTEPSVIVVDGWRLGLAICKDTGVAEHAIATASLGIDAYVAGVCETEADRDVQPARAARVIDDHRVWVAVASFAGPTGGGFDETAGRSTVWRPDGSIAATVDRRPGRIARTTIST
ncbi:MAG: carbon-nitrogen hydrolase family protein [Acidimicrobiales bacterium]